MAEPLFRVAVLSFGDDPRELDLLDRCLGSLAPHLGSPHLAELVVVLNDPGTPLVELACRRAAAAPRWTVLSRIGRRAKYPALRRVARGPVAPQAAPATHLAWFDDDSFVRPETDDFLGRCARAVAGGADLVGSPYSIRLRPGQPEWIAAQPWHRGGRYRAGDRVGFVTGGFWLARLDRLAAVDYPFPGLEHNGGDVMLGVCAAEAGWRVVPDRLGVAINADAAGRESRAGRRGLSTPPIGARA